MSSRAPTQAITRSRWLLPARVAWVVVAIVTLGVFASSVPARFAELAHPSKNVSEALVELGLSASAYALYNVAMDTIFVSVFAAVAIVIFWRRSGDPMALLVATMLVVWGPLNGLFVLTPGATEGMYGLLRAASGSVLTYVGYIATSALVAGVSEQIQQLRQAVRRIPVVFHYQHALAVGLFR